MNIIGLKGGMSWGSTQTYYRLINQKVRDQLGELHSAKLVLKGFAPELEMSLADADLASLQAGIGVL